MVLELAALVVSIINSIFAGIPIFANLWNKIKSFFGGSQKKLRESSQALIEAQLGPLLRQDRALRRQSEAYYRSQGVIRGGSQWETWTAADDLEWA